MPLCSPIIKSLISIDPIRTIKDINNVSKIIPHIIATEIMGVKFGGCGINLEKTNITINIAKYKVFFFFLFSK
tara:strand:+ start:275 stop:493 length:219 start_codon:yes stop_codon:yes gene_type:complete